MFHREVHISDLIRAHEGNPDVSATEANKIHWGKFNMFGRFIQSTTHCQLQCQLTSDYNFTERPKIRNLVFNEYVMPEDVSIFFFWSKVSELSAFTDAGFQNGASFGFGYC